MIGILPKKNIRGYLRMYRILKNNNYSLNEFSLVSIRFQDRYNIMNWRNEQIIHLRQNEPLNSKTQDSYFKDVILKEFEMDQPPQILFSFLEKGNLVGYGGLVHIDWDNNNAEISFLMNTILQEKFFNRYWSNFLTLLKNIAFNELNFYKIYVYAFDIRAELYPVLEMNEFKLDCRLKNHCRINGFYKDVVIYSHFNEFK